MVKIKIEDIKVLENSFYLSKILPFVKEGIFDLDVLDMVGKDNSLLKTKIQSELELRNLIELLPLGLVNDIYTIQVEENKSLFERIKYQDFGLVNLSLKYNTKSDLFFNKINLQVVQILYPGLNIDLFKTHLKNLGFQFNTEKVTVSNKETLIISENDSLDFLKVIFRIDLSNNRVVEKYFNFAFMNTANISRANMSPLQKTFLFKLFFVPEINIEEFLRKSGFNGLSARLLKNGISSVNRITISKLSELLKINEISLVEVSYLIHKIISIDANHLGFASDELLDFLNYNRNILDYLETPIIKSFQKRYYSDLFTNIYKQKRIECFQEFCSKSKSDPMKIRLLCDFSDFVQASVYLTGKFSVQFMLEKILNESEEINLYDCVLDFEKYISCKRETKRFCEPEVSELAINDFLKDIDEHLSERQKEVLILKNVNRFTLEKISKHIKGQEVTRERVRQILNATEKQIEAKIQNNKLQIKKYLISISGNKLCYSKSQILAIIDPHLRNLFGAIDLKSIGLYWSEVLKLYVMADRDIDKYFEDNFRRSNLSKEDLIRQIKIDFGISLENILTKEMIYSFASKIGHVDNHGRFYDYKPTKGEKYSIVISSFSKGISLSTNFNEFIERHNEMFPDDYLDPLRIGVRNIEARLSAINDVIVLDTRTFIHVKNLNLSQEMKEYILFILDLEIEKNNTTTANFLYKKYQEKLSHFGVLNKLHLYSLIGYLAKDNYFYGKGNTLTISTSVTDLKKSNKERLIELLVKSDNRAKKVDIIKNLGILGVNVDMLVADNNEFFGTGEWVFLSKLLEPYEDDIAYINSFIIEYFKKNDILTSNQLIIKLLHNPSIYAFFEKFEINDGMKLVWLLNKHTDFKTEGASILIYNDRVGYKNIFQYICAKYERFSRNQIMLLMKELEYSNSATLQIMDELRKSKIYARISVDEFFKFDNLGINDEILNTLETYLDTQMTDGFIVSKNLKGFRSVLPKINISWTHFLVSDIALRISYSIVSKEYRDFWTDPVIITNKSEFTSFENLVEMIIIKHDLNGKHFSETIDCMIALGVINSTTKELAQEIKESKLINIDDFGRVTVNV